MGRIKLITIIIVLILVSLFLGGSIFPMENTSYCNEEVCIDFGEEVLIKNLDFEKTENSYFKEAITLVKFQKFKTATGLQNIQQVGPDSDGYLAKMYVLPHKPLKELKKIYLELSADSEERYIPFNLNSEFQPKIGWRHQIGKTRLDHYIAVGKKYNYLFISSPYGSNGILEKIVNAMEWK